MGNIKQNEYFPNYASPPGDTLLEIIEDLGMTQAELADRTGRPKKTINEIIKGKAAITPETALQFERVLGVPAHLWNQREKYYRELLAQQEERERLEKQLAWLKKFPLKEMVKRGWLESYKDSVDQMCEVLRFFGIASPEQWQATSAAFRQTKAFTVHEGAVAAWLRRGELLAQQLPTEPYKPRLFRATLAQLRALTKEPPKTFVPQLTVKCAASGVAVVFVPELPGARVSGATRWLTPTKALLQLSFRYQTADQVWFSFFHEAGHILLHGKRLVFLETEAQAEQEEKEAEANRFAADLLIPPAQWQTFLTTQDYSSKAAICSFATALDLAPGIVVGRLQHEKLLPFASHNDLKQRLAEGDL